MSGDFETLEINQPKITYLKPEENTEWLDKLINLSLIHISEPTRPY